MDDLERRIREARPVSGHRDMPLSDRAKRELAELMMSASAPQRRMTRTPRRRRTATRIIASALAVAAAGVIGTIAALSLLPPGTAYAATPPLLEVAPVAGTTAEILTRISERVVDDHMTTSPDAYRIDVQAWSLDTEDDGEELSSEVVAQNYAFARAADGSFTTTVTVASSGEPLWAQTWSATEYTPRFDQPFPEQIDDVRDYFARAAGEAAPLTAGALIGEATDLLMEQQLTSAQLTTLLEYFASLPDLAPLGEVTDRLGRPAMAFAAVDPRWPDVTKHLIVSTETGRIIATESIYAGTGRTDIPSPSVTDYYLWK